MFLNNCPTHTHTNTLALETCIWSLGLTRFFFKESFFFNLWYMSLCVHEPHVWVSMEAREDAGWPGTGVKAVIRHPMWVLRTELRLPRTANTPDCWAIFPAPATHSFNQYLQSGVGWPQTTGLRNCWRVKGLKWGCQLINLPADWWVSLFSPPGNFASLESIAEMPVSCQKLCWQQNVRDVMQPDKGQGHKQASTRKMAQTEKLLFRLEKESSFEATHPLTTDKDGPYHLGRTYMVTAPSHHRMTT